MATFDKQHIDDLNLSVTLTVDKTEVQGKFKSELNRFAQRAAIKGFRKGKTPLTYVKKIYGPEILNNIVNSFISDNISNFLEKENLDILGQPIPSEDSPENKYSTENFEDLVFKFDFGLAPKFELAGLSKDYKFNKYIPQVPEKWVNEAIETDQNKKGERVSIEGGDIKDKDIIKLQAKEENGDLERIFSVLFDDLSEDLRAQFTSMKVGDTTLVNILNLERNQSEENIRKFILGVDESVTFNHNFNVTIEEITRIEPAQITEDYLTTTYGEGITTIEEAKAFLYKEFSQYFVGDSWGLLIRELQEHIISQNNIPLPDAFLKRWLAFSSEKNTAEVIERSYNGFAQNLRWTMVRDAIISEYNVHIHDADIKDQFRDRLRGTYGAQMGEDLLEQFAEYMMADALKKKSKELDDMRENAMFNQVFKTIEKQVEVTEVSVDWDTFEDMRNKALEAARKTDEIVSSLDVEEYEAEEVA
jgi:trigger factor